VDQLGLAVHADMQLHSEIPLLTFAGLVHLRAACFGCILGRPWRRDDGGIDNSAAGHLHPTGGKVLVHTVEQRIAEVVPLQQMAKVQDGGFIGYRLAAEVDADEAPHEERVV
jgi:hypothetical protein